MRASKARQPAYAFLTALMVVTSMAVVAGCVERRELEETSTTDADGSDAEDQGGSGGAAPAGSGGQPPGTETSSGGAPGSSGGVTGQTGVDAGVAQGSGGARTGGASGLGTGGVVSNAGTGGVAVAASGGSGGGKGGTPGTAAASGGTTAPTVDAGSAGAPACTGAYHLCGASCVSNSSVNSCGSSCSPCSVPAGGAASCDGTRCGFSCPGGKVCGVKCIAATACCGDGDCPAKNGAAGKCNTATNACQYPTCGNAVVEMGEQCDPPATNSCSAACMTITAATRTPLYNFDAGISPWVLYMTSPERLATNTRLSHDGKGGEGSSGALKLEAPFDAANQKVEIQDTQATPVDMHGRTIRARVRLVSGLSDDTAHPGAIKLFAKSGANYDYASGAWTYLKGTGWADVTMVADQPDFVQGTFAPAQIRQIGFELRVFSETQRPAAAVITLDSISY